MSRTFLELRRESRRVHPSWTLTMRAKWVLAHLRAQGGTYRFPIGEKYMVPMNVPPMVPEFLRKLPSGTLLEVPDDKRESIRRAVRYILRLVA